MEITGSIDRKTGKVTLVGGMTDEKRDALARMLLRMAAIAAKGAPDEAMWQKIAERAGGAGK